MIVKDIEYDTWNDEIMLLGHKLQCDWCLSWVAEAIPSSTPISRYVSVVCNNSCDSIEDFFGMWCDVTDIIVDHRKWFWDEQYLASSKLSDLQHFISNDLLCG